MNCATEKCRRPADFVPRLWFWPKDWRRPSAAIFPLHILNLGFCEQCCGFVTVSSLLVSDLEAEAAGIATSLGWSGKPILVTLEWISLHGNEVEAIAKSLSLGSMPYLPIGYRILETALPFRCSRPGCRKTATEAPTVLFDLEGGGCGHLYLGTPVCSSCAPEMDIQEVLEYLDVDKLTMRWGSRHVGRPRRACSTSLAEVPYSYVKDTRSAIKRGRASFNSFECEHDYKEHDNW